MIWNQPSHLFLTVIVITCSECTLVQHSCLGYEHDVVCLLRHQSAPCSLNRIILLTDDSLDSQFLAPIVKTITISASLFTFYDNLSTLSLEAIRKIIVHNLDNQMNRPSSFLVMTSRFHHILDAAENYFNAEGRSHGSLALHRSKWLIFLQTQDELAKLTMQQYSNSTYDHVTAVILRRYILNSICEIQTYMWHKGRIKSPQIVRKNNFDYHNSNCFLFPNLKFGLNGRHLTMLTKIDWGFLVFVKYDTQKGAHEYAGYLIDICNVLAEVMNFSYSLLPDPTHEQLSWDDIATKVISGDVDIGLTVWSYTWKAIYNFSLTYPVLMDSISGIYRYDLQHHQRNSFFIICPFSPLTYVVMAISCIITSLVYVFIVGFIYPDEQEERIIPLKLFSSCERREGQQQQRNSTISSSTLTILLRKINTTFWTLFASIFTPGYLPCPIQMSARVLLFLWGMVTVTFYALYTGSLMSEILTRHKVAPFQTFQQMIDRGDYRWGTIEYSAIDQIMKTTKNGIIQRLNASASNVPGANMGNTYDTLTYQIETKLPNKLVFLYFHSLLKQVKARLANSRQFQIVPEPLLSANQGFICPFDSDLCQLFSKSIQILYDSNILDTVYQAHAIGNSTTVATTTAGEMPKRMGGHQHDNISLDHMRSTFLVVGAILGVALFVFVSEIFICAICSRGFHLKYKSFTIFKNNRSSML